MRENPLDDRRGREVARPAMVEPEIQPCIVCASETERDICYVKWGYEILRCRVCGLGRTGCGAEFDPAALYGEGYFQGARRDGYLDYAASEAVLRAEFRRTVRHLRHHRPAGGRLLEVGCAYGFFPLEAQPHFTCTGFELSEAAIAECRKRGLNVFGSLSDVAVRRRGPFDVAVLLDCIEHLADPVGTLLEIGRNLSTDGLVLITTGNWDSLYARATGRYWRLMTPPQHLFYFSRTTLNALLGRAGLRAVACDRPWKVVPLGLAAYQIGSRLGLPVNLFDTVRIVAQRS